MTWLDDELMQKKGKTSYLTAGIATFLMAVLVIPLLLAVVQGFLPSADRAKTLATLIVVGFAPFLVWFVVGSARGFR
ncbi:MAG TPA: hypothetical protein VNZ52_11975 [Candidatus Thermoplasmatota archaeon]|nr:hypothetical protein [Candidatus Thermoplasmatota archaeon]